MKRFDNKFEEQFRREVLVKTGRFFGALLFVTMMFRHLIVSLKPIPFTIATFLALTLISFPIWPKKYFSVKTGSTFLLISLSILAFLAGFTNGGVRAPGVILLVLIPLFGIITGGTRGAILGCSLVFTAIIALVFLERHGAVFPMEHPELLPYYFPVVLFAVAISSLVIGMVYENYRKLSEQKIIEISMKAQQASKMAALGEMAAGMAHEINNPLSIISLNTELIVIALEKADFDKNAVTQKLNIISKTTFRAAKIIEGLRVFARDTEADPYQQINLMKLFSDVLDLCQERFTNYGVEIRVAQIPDLQIECSPVQISQVILNLLNNSFDAIQNRTEKWISIEAQLTKDNFVNFIITDSGQGIFPPLVDSIMQPFFTTKPAGKGTGLGLSISKGIIEAHHGLLWVDKNHENTRFVFKLPLKQA